MSELFDAFPDTAFELSAEGVVLDLRAPRSGGAALPESIVGKRLREVLPESAADAIMNASASVLGSRAPRTFEFAWAPRAFEGRMVHSTRGTVTFVRDVTDRVNAEKRLAESEKRFELMANGAPVLLWMAGTDSRCNFFNQVWLRFTGRPLEREMGEGWAEGIHHEDFQRSMTTYMEAFVERRAFTMEYRLRRADGQYRWIFDQGAPRYLPDGTFAGYIGSCVDVTEQKEARDALSQINQDLERRVAVRTSELEARLREREVLLREVHHRVKNNLQLVSSLLGLQSQELGDPAARAIFDECQARVHSIALVHESLYQRSMNFLDVPFSEYVRSLVRHVVSATGMPDDQVAVDVKISDVSLAIDKAIPCGLILNELVTNAMKHAFPNRRKGRLSIELAPADAGGKSLVLAVADDGVGMSADVDVRKSSSLGTRLVTALVAQLGGRLAVERSGGAAFRVTFPRD